MSNIREILTVLNIDYIDCGDILVSACPIHRGDNPSAFNINIDHTSRYYGTWFCNTHECHSSGNDIISLVIGVTGMSFSETLKWLDQYEIVELEKFKKLSFRPIPRLQVRQRLLYPCSYYIKRGFSEKILNEFDVGYCYEKGKMMSGRAVFPVYNEEYMMVGCVGRATWENPYIKWKNSKGFHKSDHLYGYHTAINRAIMLDCVVLVEGQGDLLRLREAGISNSMGLFGCSLSETQLTLLQDVKNITLALDNDEVGISKRLTIAEKYPQRKFDFIDIPGKDIGSLTVEEVRKII